MEKAVWGEVDMVLAREREKKKLHEVAIKKEEHPAPPLVLLDGCEAERRLRRALATMSDVNQWLGKHDGHVEAVKLGQAMRDVRWVLVGLEGGQDE